MCVRREVLSPLETPVAFVLDKHPHELDQRELDLHQLAGARIVHRSLGRRLCASVTVRVCP